MTLPSSLPRKLGWSPGDLRCVNAVGSRRRCNCWERRSPRPKSRRSGRCSACSTATRRPPGPSTSTTRKRAANCSRLPFAPRAGGELQCPPPTAVDMVIDLAPVEDGGLPRRIRRKPLKSLDSEKETQGNANCRAGPWASSSLSGRSCKEFQTGRGRRRPQARRPTGRRAASCTTIGGAPSRSFPAM